ncbi:MAG: NADPH-dependent FMN reductase [Lysobacterales bacterium]
MSKLLIFAASNSRDSINRRLAEFAGRRFHSKFSNDAQITTLDLNSLEMPIYSIDRETADGIPQEASTFLEKIELADALIVSFAEHNGSYSAAFKNIFDWASRINAKVYQNKLILMLSTSPGKRGAANVLKIAVDGAPHFAGNVVASLSVESFYETFDSENDALISEPHIAKLDVSLNALSDELAKEPR